MEIEKDPLNRIEHTAWVSWWYHDRRAGFFGWWIAACHALGAAQILLACTAFAAGWDAEWGTLFGLFGCFSVVLVHFLRWDIREHAHRNLATTFGAIANDAELMTESDPQAIERLRARLNEAQRDETKNGSQLEVLVWMANNAWHRNIGEEAPQYFVKISGLQRFLAPWRDFGVKDGPVRQGDAA